MKKIFTRLAVLTLSTLAAIAAIVLLWGHWPAEMPEAPTPPSVGKRERRPSKIVVDGSASPQNPESVPPTESVKNASAPTPDQRWDIFIRFVTAMGATTPRLDFNAEISRPGETGTRRLKLAPLVMATDQASAASIAVPGKYDRIVVLDEDEDWHFEKLIFTRAPHEFSTYLTIECYPTVDLFFDVFFEDGRPCEAGSLQIVKARGFRSQEYSCVGKHVEVSSVPIVPLVVRVRPVEPGYENTNLEVPADAVFDGAVIPLRIPRARRPKGDVAIELGDTVDRVEFLEVYNAANGVRQYYMDKRDTANGRIELHDLYAGEYFVRGVQNGKVYWTTFSISRGERTDVRVEMVEPAAVSVRVLKPDGSELTAAMVRIPLMGYTDYPTRPGIVQSGLFATTSNSGTAKLTGLHPAITEIVIEAEGYQHQVVPVVLISGELTLLPNVVLEPAKGRVTVRIQGADSPTAYEVAILDPNGGTGYSTLAPVPVSGEVTYESVSCRTYRVLVRPVGGGKVVSRLVELTIARAEVSVTLDVSSIEERG